MKCAFYEKEITPPLGSDIPGYYANRFTTGVQDKLYAKAAVFSGDNQEIAAILTIDAVSVSADFCRAVTDRVRQFTGIPAEKVAIIANHTHYGVPFGDVISQRDPEFCALLERLAADCITLAWQRLETCTLSYGIGHEDTVAFNRDFILKDGAIVTNASGHKENIVRAYGGIDPDLPVLTVKNSEGQVIGVLFTYALHQDTTGGMEYSGDYSSEISHALKERFGHQMVSIYMPGCCGDINHIDVWGERRTHRQIGRIIADEIARVMCEDSAAVACRTVATAYRVVPMVRRRATPEQIEKAKWIMEDRANRTSKYDMTGQNAPLLLQYEEDFRDAPKTVDVPVQVFVIGDIWTMIFPFEVYHRYGLQIKQACPNGKWLMSELANIEAGYVPIPELFDTDAYPVQLCHGSWLMPEAGDQLVESVSNLVSDLNNSLCR